MPKHLHRQRRQTVQSNTYRFFVDTGSLQRRDVVIEDDELAHQLGVVLRLRPGEQVLLLDNSGWQYIVTIGAIERGRVAGTVERKELAGGEPRTKLTLYVALLRSDRFEWVLQKGTELGVSAFVPLICERGTLAETEVLSGHRLQRWQRIVREAAEQSRRGKLPRLAAPQPFPAACQQAAQREAAILLWEGAGVPPLRQALRGPASVVPAGLAASDLPDAVPARHPFSVALFSGPEGGFTSGEFEMALGYSMIAVTLGPRTLRAETAPLVAASAILYELGDLE